jgi:hypothetical protein
MRCLAILGLEALNHFRAFSLEADAPGFFGKFVHGDHLNAHLSVVLNNAGLTPLGVLTVEDDHMPRHANARDVERQPCTVGEDADLHLL